MSASIKINSKDLARSLVRFPNKFSKFIKKELNVVGGKFESDMKRNRLRPPGMHVRTKALIGSMGHVTTGDKLDDIKVTMFLGGAAAQYARIHETGGTIKAKPGKWLAIPMPSQSLVLTPAGVSIKRPRDFPKSETFFQRSKKGNLILFLNGPKIQPLFVLKKSVRIPARLGMMRLWEKKYEKRILNKHINIALKKTLDKF